jgi:Family of unknown function (DUF6262)
VTGEHSSGLRDAAAMRSAAAAERARRALTDQHRRGESITFAGIAAHANVSRQFLYSHADLRAEIERLRGEPQPAPARLPPRERASDRSIRSRLRATLDENKLLRDELARLREELALTHGQVRELELAQRAATRVSDPAVTTHDQTDTFVTDMSATPAPRHHAAKA